MIDRARFDAGVLPEHGAPVASERAASDALWTAYRWMSAGLGTTGIVALLTARSPVVLGLVLGTPLFYVLLFGELGLVVGLSWFAHRLSTLVAGLMFFVYAALTGATFSMIFMVFTATSIASMFFVTAAAFAGLSLVGWFTKRDLGVIGRFATFALIGLIVAAIVNLFLRSSGLHFAISALGVVLFAGLTAYDTQRLKNMFAKGVVGNMAIVGALTLYLDFINMFLFLLTLFGRRRS